MTGLTHYLATRVVGDEFKVTDEARRAAAWYVLDTLAVGVKGNVIEADFVRAAVDAFRQIGAPGNALVVPDLTRAHPAVAAAAHAASIHTIDLDDSYLEGVKAHFSASLVPVVLAVGQDVGASGNETLDAYVRGFEVGARLGHVISPSHLRRWHPTGTLGVIAAAAAAAALYRLDLAQTMSAIGLAADRSAGGRFFAMGGDVSKPLHAAWAAHDGIASALMARVGVQAATDFIEGAHGFVETFSDAEPVIPADDGRALLMNNSTKLYPAMHGLHSSIELALAAVTEHPISGPADVRIIKAHQCVGRANMGRNWRPATALAAKLSLPFSVAVAMLDGRYTLAQCTNERLSDPVLAELMDKIEIVPSEELEAQFGARIATRLEVEFSDGSRFDATFVDPPGTPQRPIDDAVRLAKYEDLISDHSTLSGRQRLQSTVLGLLADSTPRDVAAALITLNEEPA